jgi:hypothetical protein
VSYEPKTYWEGRADDWAQSQFPTYGQWLEIAEHVDPELTTIELGSGTGRWSPYFDRYAGFEISGKLVKYAKKENPGKLFFEHDVRQYLPHAFKVDGEFVEAEQYFSFTCLLHVPPKDIKRILFPDHARVVLIEPHGESTVEHCFNHDYEKLFNVTKVREMGKQSLYVREPL